MLKWSNRNSFDMKVEMNTTRKNVINQFLALTILAVISVTKAEVDCFQRPPHVKPNECCQIEIITDELKETCNEYMPDKGPEAQGSEGRGPPHGRGHHNHCFLSCIVNATGILIDDEVQQTTLESHLRNTIEDPDIVEFVGSNFMKCSDEFQKMSEKFKNKPQNHRGPPGGGKCGMPPRGGMLMHCALMKTLTECPESVWSNSDDCNAARDHFNNCKRPHGPDRPDDGQNQVEDEEI